ncbi:probable Putative cystathionine gamma-synthase YLL058W [Zygosaccharomyces bailii]|nr:probable Putative cystathionine gamma-synthase YLL058W [Zygosaccharomyces bailii]
MTEIDFGQPLPSDLEYAVSFGIPTWDSAISYAEKDPNTLSKMVTGYPRYFPQPAVQQLCSLFIEDYGRGSEGCRPFPSVKSATKCLEYVRSITGPASKAHLEARKLEFETHTEIKTKESTKLVVNVAAVLASDDEFDIVKEYWKLTGEGVSSRQAAFVNTFWNNTNAVLDDKVRSDIFLMVKEGEESKRLIKTRIVDNHTHPFGLEIRELAKNPMVLEPSKDVHLVSSGMAAIFTARKLLDFWEKNVTSNSTCPECACQRKQSCLPSSTVVIFGFPFKDTQVIMEKFGAMKFFGLGNSRDLIGLKDILLKGEQRILAIFVETPSNPLLNMPNLGELRKLADEFGFFIVIDDTIGGLNVNILPYADVVCTSITKLFSGTSNVMGGSVLLNPSSKLYSCARRYFESGEFEDLLWYQDAIVLENNSRDFEDRTVRANKNTKDLLHKMLLPQEGKTIKKIYYPTTSSKETFENYEAVRNELGGYGCMLSLSFYDEEDARIFYDSLKVYKGPSNGTNFTLACSYVQLAHRYELNKVSEFGADPNLVRVSVGLEDIQQLLNVFSDSIEVVRKRHSRSL